MRAGERGVDRVFGRTPRFTLDNHQMEPPRYLLDALSDSIASGTFINTKLYVFSRREPSGRVGSPRALYCNSHVLSTAPYFSARGYQKLLRRSASDCMTRKCSQMGFRKDRLGISTEDSPLTTALTSTTMTICPTATLKMGPLVLKRKSLPKMTTPKRRAVLRVKSREYRSPHSPEIYHGHCRALPTLKMMTSQPRCPLNCAISPANSYRRPDGHLTRMGKVAIIRDMGAVTYVRSVAN